MKLSFESNLEYQRDAIQSVVSLFEGQARRDSGFRYGLDGDRHWQDIRVSSHNL